MIPLKNMIGVKIDSETERFFLKIGKEIGEVWRKSLTRGNEGVRGERKADCPFSIQ